MILPFRRVRLVQVGFGHIGQRRTVITSRHPGIDLVGVVDIKPSCLLLAREVVSERCALGTDYVAELGRLRPDAVIFSTPNALHAPMTWTALGMGIHVLCEKPLALDSSAARRCVARARRLGLVCKVGTNHRMWRPVRKMMELLANGAIGDVRAIQGEIGYLLPDSLSEWYREKSVSGGGTIIDNCPHLLDLVGQILQQQDGDVVRRVRCVTSRDTLGLEVEDQAEGSLVSERGRLIELRSTWSDGDYRMSLDIQGERGRIVLESFDALRLETAGDTQRWTYSDVPSLESWDLDIQSFLDAIRLGRAVPGTGDDGVAAMRIIDALYRSNKARSMVEV